MSTVLNAGRTALMAVLVGVACTPADGDTPEARTGVPAAALQAPAPRPAPDHAWVIFGADTVVAEVARTADQRAEGLMYRQELPDGVGMLFVFETSEVRSFWMQNTYVALDIAYMDASFTIVDIQQMEPLTTDPHESRGPAMFALEVRKGWFAERGIRVGDRAEVVFGLR
ncbi:MAG TPA: DUF192 domain-containing protein [Longimicrobiales bacterium]|nr:DUF192 domain-containing protein [Longimicrobiales bacterium]